MKEITTPQGTILKMFESGALWVHKDGKAFVFDDPAEQNQIAHFIQSNAPDQELTPEVLEGMGFVKVYSHWQVKLNHGVLEWYKDGSMYICYDADPEINVDVSHITTVSQLRTLYHALTGQHLKA